MVTIRPDIVIDVKGLQCPRPLIKTKQTLNTMQQGQILEVIANDNVTKSTIPSLLKHSGDKLLNISEDDGGVMHFLIKKI